MMYKKILEAELEAPHFMSDAALDLCQRLLIRDPALRLGSGASGVEEMKGHAFFRGIDWTALEMKLVRVGRRGGGAVARQVTPVSQMTAACQEPCPCLSPSVVSVARVPRASHWM